jgi:hypothetical protein
MLRCIEAVISGGNGGRVMGGDIQGTKGSSESYPYRPAVFQSKKDLLKSPTANENDAPYPCILGEDTLY